MKNRVRAALLRGSVLEDGPADPVSAALVLEYKLAEMGGDLVTLPVAFSTCGFAFLIAGCCSCCCLDGVRGRAQVVFGNAGDAGRLAGCVGRESWSATQGTRSAHRVSSDRAGRHHLRFTPGPGSCGLDRCTRAAILSVCFLEQP